MSVPNQKIIINTIKEQCNKNHTYAAINIEALTSAANNLKGEAFKLWTFFAKNQSGYGFELSRVAAEQFGIKKTSYYDSMKILEEKGYLVPQKEGSNLYTFVEFPKSGKFETVVSEIRNEFSEIRNEVSEIRNEESGIQQRNNTNNTEYYNNNMQTKEFQFLDEEEEEFYNFEYNCFLRCGDSIGVAKSKAIKAILSERSAAV